MSDTESVSSDEEDFNDLTNPDVTTKYRMAADFVKVAMGEVIGACKPGAKVIDLCLMGDAKMTEQTDKVYTKPVEVDGKKVPVDKGVAFPTAVSLNGVLANFCPDKEDATEVADGDIVKIEMACQIDGYVVTAAHTVKCGEDATITGTPADVTMAARYGLEAALRCLKPGTSSLKIIEVVKKVAEAYGVEPCEGVKCNNVKRFVLEASKEVPIRETVEEKAEDFEIEENEVYAMEVAMTSAKDGKTSHKDGEIHVYRRAVDVNYNLKMKAAKQVFAEINNTNPSFPFSVRALESKLGAKAKLGLKEIVEHDLLHPYPVTVTKDADDVVATFKVTCLVMSSGITKLTDFAYPEAETEKKIEDEEVLGLLQRNLKPKKKKKKNKK